MARLPIVESRFGKFVHGNGGAWLFKNPSCPVNLFFLPTDPPPLLLFYTTTECPLSVACACISLSVLSSTRYLVVVEGFLRFINLLIYI